MYFPQNSKEISFPTHGTQFFVQHDAETRAAFLPSSKGLNRQHFRNAAQQIYKSRGDKGQQF